MPSCSKFRELVLELTGFDIRNIPASMRNMTPKMFSLAYRKYVMPMMKGAHNMRKKNRVKPMFRGMMPMMPAMPPMPVLPPMPPMPFMNGQGWFGTKKKDDASAQLDDFKSNVKTYREKNIDMQKSTVEASKDQWNQFFEHIMDMQDTFVASLSDDAWSLPWLPDFGIFPREFMERMQEFQKMSKEHFEEQADSFVDFFFQGQEQVNNLVDAVADSGEKDKKTEEPEQTEDGADEHTAQ